MISKGLVTFASSQQCSSKFTLVGFTKQTKRGTPEKNSAVCGMSLGELAPNTTC